MRGKNAFLKEKAYVFLQKIIRGIKNTQLSDA